MIVKDGAATIERAITSVREHVDEVNIYDTGSADGTPELVERLAGTEGGAVVRLVRGEWRDSFAWAREQSFAMASSAIDWLVYLDADEEILGASELRKLAAEAPVDLDAFLFFWDIERDPGGNTVESAWRDRMLRRASGFRWRGAAHAAAVLPDGRQPSLAVVPAERVRFVHHREENRWHPARALRLLEAELERVGADGADDDTLSNLANELFWRAEFARAATFYRLFLDRIAGRSAVERAHANHQLAAALRVTGDAERARALELELQQELPDWPETLVGLIETALALDDREDAERWAARAVEVEMPDSPYIRESLRLRALPLIRLSELRLRRGDVTAAAARMADLAQLAAGDPFVEARVAAFTRALEAGNDAVARRLLRELAARYDPVVQARARQLWLAADPASDADDVAVQSRPRAG